MIVERSKAIVAEVSKALLGKRDVIEKTLMAIYAGGHVLLEDVPGTGKTTLALALSRALDLDYKRVQFTPCLLYTSTCNSNAPMTPIICYGVAIVAVLLGIILPVIAIPAGVLALAAAAVAISEALDHPLLSQVFTKGVSQNIVAKYEPTQSSDAAGSRRRKVIAVSYTHLDVYKRQQAEIPTIATPTERWSEKGCLLSDCHFALRAIRTREAIAVTTTKSVGWKKPEGN